MDEKKLKKYQDLNMDILRTLDAIYHEAEDRIKSSTDALKKLDAQKTAGIIDMQSLIGVISINVADIVRGLIKDISIRAIGIESGEMFNEDATIHEVLEKIKSHASSKIDCSKCEEPECVIRKEPFNPEEKEMDEKTTVNSHQGNAYLKFEN